MEAHPPSLRYQLTKFIRRHSLLAAALVAITLAVSFGLIAITWGSLRACAAEQDARLALVSEKKSNERAQRRLPRSPMHSRPPVCQKRTAKQFCSHK